MTTALNPSLFVAAQRAAVGDVPLIGPGTLTVLAVISLALLVVAFVHAGAALMYRQRAGARGARYERLTAHWNPEIVAFLFENRTAQDVQKIVASEDQLLFVNALLQYSRRVDGDELVRIRELAAPFLPLIASRLRSRSAAVRARAIQTLGELGLMSYVHEIVAALDDPSPLVSIIASRVLCDPNSVDYLPEVLGRLSRFRSWTPTFLASMLASAGSLGTHALRAALWDNDLDDTSRRIAADALRELNDFRAAGAAAHVLGQGGERGLVVAALRLLGHVGQEVNLAEVLEKIEDPDFVVRVAAVDALAALGGRPELERLQGLLYHDPSRWVALHAARGLLDAGHTAALRTLAHGEHERAPIGAQVLAESGRR